MNDEELKAAAAVAEERKRTADIYALAQEHGISDAVRVNAWLATGASVGDVATSILKDKKAAAPQAFDGTAVVVGADRSTEKPFASFAQYLTSARNAELAPNAMDPRLLPLRAAGLGLQEGVGSDGGFLVPAQFAQEQLFMSQLPLLQHTQVLRLQTFV